MIPTNPEPAICIDGPLKGKETTIECIGPGSPCDYKFIRYERRTLKYYTKLSTKTSWDIDQEGRYKLYYDKEH